MRPMDHAEAHELLADLALEPATLGSSEATEEHDRLRLHIEGCPTCRADLEAWQRTHRAIDDALTTPDGRRGRLADVVAEGPIVPPPTLRAAIAAIPGATGPTTRPGPAPAGLPRAALVARLGWRAAPFLAAVAVLVISVVVLRNQASSLDAAHAETRELAQVTAVLGRLLGEPGHRVVPLTAADGTTEGSVAWSSHDLAVMTTVLDRPPAGQVYRCWIERDGVRSPVGQMWFVGDLAYWTGSLDDWATISLDEGGRFGVSLEPAGGGTGGRPVLVGDLPG
jgi:hypothetical protein